jgi:hypothetical protein
MDKNEFRKRLEQVAELKDIKPARTANYRPAIEYITEVDEDGEEYQIPVQITENPTLGFDLVKVKDKHELCQLGCGEVVTNQVIELRHATTPKKHWRTRCRNCDCYVSPDGQGFIKGSHAVQHAFAKHFNQESGRSKSSKVESPPRVTEFDDYTEITTNDSIIRQYK